MELPELLPRNSAFQSRSFIALFESAEQQRPGRKGSVENTLVQVIPLMIVNVVALKPITAALLEAAHYAHERGLGNRR